MLASWRVWQLRSADQNTESRTVRLIGATFFALAAYLLAEGIRDLVAHARPLRSVPGLVVTAAALVVMPGPPSRHRTGQGLDSRTLTADGAETALCALTSATALIGIGQNPSGG